MQVAPRYCPETDMRQRHHRGGAGQPYSAFNQRARYFVAIKMPHLQPLRGEPLERHHRMMLHSGHHLSISASSSKPKGARM